jgi:hypothetical protein
MDQQDLQHQPYFRVDKPEPLAARAGGPQAPPPLRLLRGRGLLARLQVPLVRLGPLGHSSAKAFEHGWQSLRSPMGGIFLTAARGRWKMRGGLPGVHRLDPGPALITGGGACGLEPRMSGVTGICGSPPCYAADGRDLRKSAGICGRLACYAEVRRPYPQLTSADSAVRRQGFTHPLPRRFL